LLLPCSALRQRRTGGGIRFGERVKIFPLKLPQFLPASREQKILREPRLVYNQIYGKKIESRYQKQNIALKEDKKAPCDKIRQIGKMQINRRPPTR
jgi:hypothetical protein